MSLLSFTHSSPPLLSTVVYLPRCSLTTSPHSHSHAQLNNSIISLPIFVIPLSFLTSLFHSLINPPLSYPSASLFFLLFSRLRLARMNEEMREAEAPLGQPGQYHSSSPTEQQYRKCIQEFICLTIEEC